MVVTKWVVTYHDYFEHFGARPQQGKAYADEESAYAAAAAIERHCGPGDCVAIKKVTEEVADPKPTAERTLAWRAQKAKEAAEMAAFFETKKELLRENMRSGSAKKKPTSSEIDLSALEGELIF